MENMQTMFERKEIEYLHFQKSVTKDMETIRDDIQYTTEQCEKVREKYFAEIEELELERSRAITLQHIAFTRYEKLKKEYDRYLTL